MSDGLSIEQRALARDVVARYDADPDLLAALDRSELNGEERLALKDLVMEDLAMQGFDERYAPTDVGRQLEELIDALNALD